MANQFYPTQNFGYGTVLTAPSPADSGTSLTLQSGEGANFPDPATRGSYPITVWPANTKPLSSNAEVITVTAKSGDTLTLDREKEGSSARSIIVGDQVAMTISADVVKRMSEAVWFYVSQASHGFSAGNPIYHNGTSWQKAKADSADTLGTHIVGAVFGTGAFIAVQSGRIEITSHGLGSAGDYLFVSADTAGALNTTEPSTYSNPIVYVESANIIHVLPFRAANLLPTGLNLQEGILTNGKISRSIVNNDLVLEILTLAGTTPSASSPVYITIGGTVRSITAECKLTLADGTNWFSSGSAVTAGLDVDYFVYLYWRAASSEVGLGLARVPYGVTYSSFSGTSTNYRYLAYSTTNAPGSADVVTLIGRLNATLSGSGTSYVWSNPTSVIVQTPIRNTRLLTFAPAPTGYSSLPTIEVAQYTLDDVFVWIHYRAIGGTSNTAALTFTTPIPGSLQSFPVGRIYNNGAFSTTIGEATVEASTQTASMYINMTGGSWTAANGKGFIGTFPYYLATT